LRYNRARWRVRQPHCARPRLTQDLISDPDRRPRPGLDPKCSQFRLSTAGVTPRADSSAEACRSCERSRSDNLVASIAIRACGADGVPPRTREFSPGCSRNPHAIVVAIPVGQYRRITSFVALLTLVVLVATMIVFIVQNRNLARTIRSQALLEATNRVLELDRMIMEDPSLFAILDSDPSTQDHPDRAKSQAFMYWVLN